MARFTEHSLFNQIDDAFHGLGSGPKAYAVDGSQLHPDLPQRTIPVTELRSILLHPSTSFDARDAALGAVVRYSQTGDSQWTTIALGLLLHGLRGAAGRLTRGFTGDVDDLDAEIIEGALRALRSCDTSKDGVASRILWAAFRSGQRIRGIDIETPVEGLEAVETGAVAGHPDLILTAAMEAGVITASEAELIGETRVNGTKMPVVASNVGIPVKTLWQRRLRAERRLVQWMETRDQ